MNARTDQQLLQEYVERRSEPAFADLVQRHIDLVYSAALRRVGDAHLAEDVTQGTFAALAQHARELGSHPVLSGWLHRTTQNIATNLIRTNIRRQAREQEVVTMNQLLSPPSDSNWQDIAPHLDAALDELGRDDRDAVMLRYFEKKSAPEIAVQLGISNDAAQKRVNRAVERLREFFAKRGISASASGLAVVISANAVQAAPVGLALTISTAAALTGTTLATTATVTATKAIAMTALQKTIVTATIAVLAGAGIYEARQSSQLRGQVQTLQRQQAEAEEQIQQLQGERDEATNRLAVLREDNERLNRNTGELIKSRGDLARLRSDAEIARRKLAEVEAANIALLEKTSRNANGILLKKLLEQMPDQKIPELSLLNDADYLDAAGNSDLETNEGIKLALSRLRFRAENLFVSKLQSALMRYTKANQQCSIPTLSDLPNYFDPPIDPTMLERYQVVDTGTNIVAGWGGGWVVTQKSVVDSERDQRWSISPVGFSPTDFKWPEQKAVVIPRQQLRSSNP